MLDLVVVILRKNNFDVVNLAKESKHACTIKLVS